MALLNPVNALVVPFLFIVTVPLAIFASITTMLAFSVLMFRVLLVYFDLALQLIPFWTHGRRQSISIDTQSPAISPTSRLSSGRTSPTTPHAPSVMFNEHRSIPRSRSARRRRPSSASITSGGTITPKSENGAMAGVNTAMMAPVGVIDRDFEGVGGWRLDDDDNWMKINSRLELPVERATSRHHQRSQSGGLAMLGEASWVRSPKSTSRKAVSPSDRERDRWAVSPNSGRARSSVNGSLALTTFDGPPSYFNELSPGQGRRVAV
jgi:hypothetical protein